MPALMAAGTNRADQPTGEGMGSNRSMLVLYGSETGHGEEIAVEIRETAERLRFEASVQEMNDVSLVSQTDAVLDFAFDTLFCCAVARICIEKN